MYRCKVFCQFFWQLIFNIQRNISSWRSVNSVLQHLLMSICSEPSDDTVLVNLLFFHIQSHQICLQVDPCSFPGQRTNSRFFSTLMAAALPTVYIYLKQTNKQTPRNKQILLGLPPGHRGLLPCFLHSHWQWTRPTGAALPSRQQLSSNNEPPVLLQVCLSRCSDRTLSSSQCLQWACKCFIGKLCLVVPSPCVSTRSRLFLRLFT